MVSGSSMWAILPSPGDARRRDRPKLVPEPKQVFDFIQRHEAVYNSPAFLDAGQRPAAIWQRQQGLASIPSWPQEIPLRAGSRAVTVTDQLQPATPCWQLKALLSISEGSRVAHPGKLFCVG
jgi:hypothetical protein